jgi:DNA topoisomerase-2
MSNDAKKYDKKSPREHVLLRPDTYVGDIESANEDMWIYNDEKASIIKKNIKFTPGLLKIFDEVLVNAADASKNDKSCDTIKIEYNKEEGYISVWNNGDNGIPVEMHPDHKIMVPTMIFGELLTSSNFNDDEKRTTGGRNGYGAKLANIFSTRFIVEIVDSKRKKKFIQEWSNNMATIGKAKITDSTAKNLKSYIKVTFYPDFKRFQIENLDNEHYELFYRRSVDISGINENRLKIYFNDKKVEASTFKNYIDLYYNKEPVYFDDSNERWTVGVLYRPDNGNDVVSFVNSINTYRGGTHVTHVVDNIIKILINDYIKKKDKEIKISPQLLKDNLVFFINSIIENPTFASQTKDTCTSKIEKFGSKYIPQAAFLKKLAKCGIVEQVVELAKFKENSSLKKTDGKKIVRIKGIPKLEDANKAGSKDSIKCSLILTEGDSAKAFAMAGLSIVGRDYFGVFPLKGKLLNVREASPTQLMNNDEINNLKQIMGLKHGENYSNETNFAQLRYGRIIILTDQDTDGSHIKGLLMNFIHTIWPTLLQRDNFITSLATPIVKAFKGKEVITFYNLTHYNDWCETKPVGNWNVKYYKGLGTSTSAEAREYFVDIEDKLINYLWDATKNKLNNDSNNESNNESNNDSNNEENKDSNDESDNEELPYDKDNDEDSILLAFDKSRADDRKVWLQNYDKNDVLLYEDKKVTFSKFVHSDLIHFSNDDLSRSIPSLIDGLKPSQRKILYGAILRGLDKVEVKVAQLAGFVSDRAAYHHGEASLMGAIIGMAQNYMGSNNINILKPNGQFGSRLKNGADAASPRYIWTKFEDLTSLIFNSEDIPVLNNQLEDNLPIEPEYYAPIIPMILVNGTQGIGTGFSTKIPPYDPKNIINNLKLRINNKEMEPMDPYWYGFDGLVAKVDEMNYEIYGTWVIKDTKLIITELPVGESTSGYKEFLEKMLEGDDVKKQVVPSKGPNKGKGKPIAKPKKEKESNPFLSYTENNTDTKIYFELNFEPDYLQNTKDIDKVFHLVKKYGLTNMNLFDKNGTIKKFDSVLDIIDQYYVVRLEIYSKRKEYQLSILEHQLQVISYKVKFIMMIVDKKLIVSNKKRTDLEEELEKLKFPQLGKTKNDADVSYNYLLSMPIYNLTQEKIVELKKQEHEKQIEYDELNILLPSDIWLNELNQLEKQYNSWLRLKLKESELNIKKPTKKSIKK